MPKKMVKKAFNNYIDSFRGLSKEVWWLALVFLINRAGTMVIPFLSIYLKEALGFSHQSMGWVLSAFGLGSMIGSWVGGKLSNKWGFYSIMFWSLLISGMLFIALQFAESFEGFCVGILVLTAVADCFRPAAYVALNAYSKPENRTRSVTLIRLAINLGFSFGPAIGGFIIAGAGYYALFWIDGLTCVGAAFLFLYLLDRKQADKNEKEQQVEHPVSPYQDKPYLLFLIMIFLVGFAFFQFLSTVPLYYREVYKMSEENIGWLLAMNGILIFLLEMPLVKYLERPGFSIYRVLFASTLLIALSFLVLNMTEWIDILIVSMGFMTIGEMMNFPFLNRFAMDRAEKGKAGDYMGLFALAFSVAHILGMNSGMQLVDRYGYAVTWYIMTGILVAAAVLVIAVRRMVQLEENIEQQS